MGNQVESKKDSEVLKPVKLWAVINENNSILISTLSHDMAEAKWLADELRERYPQLKYSVRRVTVTVDDEEGR